MASLAPLTVSFELKPPKPAKSPKPKRLKVRTDDAIALITKALSERYPSDKGGKPGLLIAHLPNGTDPGVSIVELPSGRVRENGSDPRFYLAAQRFMGPGKGEGRTNVQTWVGDDLDVVIAEAARFLATSVVHQAELDKAVGK